MMCLWGVKRITCKQAKMIAQWWADQFESPRQDDGTTSMGEALATVAASLATPSSEQKRVFRRTLFRAIIWRPWYMGDLLVDYQPCQELRRACDKAGISTLALPIKSSTRISGLDWKIWARRGHGDEPHIIGEAAREGEED